MIKRSLAAILAALLVTAAAAVAAQDHPATPEKAAPKGPPATEPNVSVTHHVGTFGGQRVAKDYVGAAALVPYFLLAISAIYLLAEH